MTENESSSTHRITIDRIVLEGASPDGLQEERFREQLTREISSRLARSASVAGGERRLSVDRASARLEAGDVTDPAAVARDIVQTIESLTRSE